MKIFRIIYFTFFLFLLTFYLLPAQTRTDSLESNLEYTEGTEKVNILKELSKIYLNDSPHKSFEYAKEALRLAKKMNDEILIANLTENIGDINFELGYIDSAKYYYQKSFELFDKSDEKESLVILYDKISNICRKNGNIEEAMENLKYALGICEEFYIENRKGTVLIRLAELYYIRGELTKAIISSFDALDLAENSSDKYILADIYANLGNIYLVLEDYEKAYEFLMLALKVAEESNDAKREIIAYNNIGHFYINVNLLENAKSYIDEAFSKYQKENNNAGFENTAYNLGCLHTLKKEYNKALEFYNQSLEISLKSNNLYLILENYLAMANTYLGMNNLGPAEEVLNKGYSFAQTYKLLNEYKLLFLYSELNKKKEKYETALTYYHKYINIKDSLLNSGKINTVAKIKTTNELQHQKNTILSLLQEKNLYDKQIEGYKVLRNVLIIGSGLILFLLVLLLLSIKNKTKTNKLLVKQNEEIKRKNYEIEEQTQYLTKLIQEHEKLSIAASKTDNAITIFDTKGKIEWVNERFTRLYGLSFNELSKKKKFLYEDIHKNPLAKVILAKAIDEKQSQIFESDVISKTGEKYRIQTTLTPILNDNKELIKLIAIDTDVSKLKKIETELQKLLVTKDKFFSIIAHDLKNPFNSLIGLAQLLVRGYDRMSDEKLRYFLNNLYQISKRGYELLINLLEWSRTQMGSISFQPKMLSVHAITEETFSLYSSKAEQKEIMLTNNTHENSEVFADQNMLKTIFRNLVSNALKFTDRGGVIEISDRGVDGFKEISIRDTGIGIQPEDVDKLFRLDESFTTEGTEEETGTGLGLILCKEFVEKHGGKIWVESKPGNGSNFLFTLPIK